MKFPNKLWPLAHPALALQYRALYGSPLFDRNWYRDQYAHLLGVEDPLLHYLRRGRLDGQRPNSWFDPVRYDSGGEVAQNPPLILQFAKEMRKAGLNISSRSDVLSFLSARAGAVSMQLGHIVSRPVDVGYDIPIEIIGRNAGNKMLPRRKVVSSARAASLVQDSSLFDLEWYGETYLKDAGAVDPVEHYFSTGAEEGFDPSPNFSTSGYVSRYPDVSLSRMNPLVHYVLYGRAEGRSVAPPDHIVARGSLEGLARLGAIEYGPIERVLRYDAADSSSVAFAPSHTVCVHMHIYFEEVLDDFCRGLRNFPFPITLLVSFSSRCDAKVLERALKNALDPKSTIVLEEVPNRGRDVAPWLVSFRQQVTNHELFCHLHSKRSHHSSSGARWFDHLLHATCGSRQVVSDIVQLFRDMPNLGMVFPPFPAFLPGQPDWGENRDNAKRLASRLGLGTLPEQCPPYPAGSFFWARSRALAPLLDAQLRFEDFDPEGGQTDGTLAHALERMVGWIPSLAGWRTCCATVDVAHNLTSLYGPHRPASPGETRERYGTHARVISPARIAVYSDRLQAELANRQPVPSIEFFGRPSTLDKEAIPAWIAQYRYFKLHPHHYFADRDVAIWVHSRLEFKGDFQELASELLESGADIGFVLHPARRTFVEEAREIIDRGLDDRSVVLHQVRRYLKMPEAKNASLFDTSLFACRPGSEAVRQFMESWWSEVRSFSYRDQLSAGVVAERTGIRWTPLLQGRSPFSHPQFEIVEHAVSKG